MDLAIDTDEGRPGDSVGFTLTVINHGPSQANNISFNTVVPPG